MPSPQLVCSLTTSQIFLKADHVKHPDAPQLPLAAGQSAGCRPNGPPFHHRSQRRHGRAPPPRTAQRSVALPTPSVQPPSLQNLKTKTSVAGNPQFVVAMAATDTSHHTSVTGNLGDSNVCEEAPI